MDKGRLDKFYYNLALPSGFSSVEKLRKASGVSKKNISKWLEEQPTYTLHKKIIKNFPRNPYNVTNIDDVWQLDLVDVANISKFNDGYKFLLNIIDLFSKFVWCVPLKNKKGSTVTDGMKKVLKQSSRAPILIQTDSGGEFVNSTFKSYLKKKNIQFHPLINFPMKAAIIERYNRTQRERMYKYFTYKNTYRYIDVLDKIVEGYNNSVHSTIGFAPSQVKPIHVKQIWERMRRKQSKIKQGTIKFSIGDMVRIGKYKKTFSKGYEENYTTEIFKVVKVINRKPQPVYEITDMQDRPIKGQFYNFELVRVRVSPQTEYKIDKILKTRKRQGIREHFVKWRGYNDSFNSWVKDSEIKSI